MFLGGTGGSNFLMCVDLMAPQLLPGCQEGLAPLKFLLPSMQVITPKASVPPTAPFRVFLGREMARQGRMQAHKCQTSPKPHN